MKSTSQGNKEELFVKIADRYLLDDIDVLTTDNKKLGDEDRKRILKEVYHSLFPISNLKEYGNKVKTIGRVDFTYQDVDEIMQVVDILSGVPDIDGI